MRKIGTFSSVALNTPKTDEDPSQDAHAFIGQNDTVARLALSDGCSDSLWASCWSKKLVEVAGHGSLLEGYFQEGLSQEKALTGWINRARAFYAPNPPPSTAREVMMAAEGDYATLLYARLEMINPFTCVLSASSIGDTCLFILDHKGAIFSTPISKSRELDKPPALVWSKNGEQEHFIHGVTRVDGPFIVLACTDQLASWFLRCHEAGRHSDFLTALTETVISGQPLHHLAQAVPQDPQGLSARHTDDLTAVLCTSDDGESPDKGSPFFTLRRAILDRAQ